MSGILLLALGSASCQRDLPGVQETVVTEGMRITAHTPSGKVVIEGGKGFARRYSGDNWSRSSTLIPRKTRWYGSLGLYDPAGSDSHSDRLLLDEGRQFFTSESEALRYLKFLSGFFGPLTFNNSGLVVAYHVTPVPGGKPVRHLTIWQIYINGAKPTVLKGAADQNLVVVGGVIPASAEPAPAPVGYPRESAVKEYGKPD